MGAVAPEGAVGNHQCSEVIGAAPAAIEDEWTVLDNRQILDVESTNAVHYHHISGVIAADPDAIGGARDRQVLSEVGRRGAKPDYGR